ncbi:DUF6702 family protein [Tenacibaculum sp. 190524A02b]
MYLLFVVLFFFHGEDVSTYTLTKINNTLYVKAKLDTSDIVSALKKDSRQIKKIDLENYFINHTTYKVNKEKASLEIIDFVIEPHHVIIKGSFKKKYGKIKELQIKNTALFEVNSKQSNIIEIRFDDMVRDFLINKQKPILNITF